MKEIIDNSTLPSSCSRGRMGGRKARWSLGAAGGVAQTVGETAPEVKMAEHRGYDKHPPSDSVGWAGIDAIVVSLTAAG